MYIDFNVRVSCFLCLRFLCLFSSTSRIFASTHLRTFCLLQLLFRRRFTRIPSFRILVIALEVLQHAIFVNIVIVWSCRAARRSGSRCTVLKARNYTLLARVYSNWCQVDIREFSFMMESISASRARFSLFRLFLGLHGLPSRPSRALTGFAAFAASSSSCLDRLPPRSTSISLPAVTDSLSGLEFPPLSAYLVAATSWLEED